MRMSGIFVDFDEIQKAMEDVVRDAFDYYLDLETGEVMVISEDIMTDIRRRLYEDEIGEIDGDIEYIEFDEDPEIPDWMADEMEMHLEVLLDESGRYVRIPEREPQRAYQCMVAFIETVQNEPLKWELESALSGKGAFRKFKDVLLRFPRERKRWHGFNAKAVKREIIEWLESLGMTALPRKNPHMNQ